MRWPVVLLAAATVHGRRGRAAVGLAAALGRPSGRDRLAGTSATTVLALALAAGGAGAVSLAWRRDAGAGSAAAPAGVVAALRAGFYLDVVQDRLVVRPALALARAVATVDTRLVDGAVEGTGPARGRAAGGSPRLAGAGVQGYLDRPGRRRRRARRRGGGGVPVIVALLLVPLLGAAVLGALALRPATADGPRPRWIGGRGGGASPSRLSLALLPGSPAPAPGRWSTRGTRWTCPGSRAIDVRFHVGVDGISLPLVVLTALLTLLCTVSHRAQGAGAGPGGVVRRAACCCSRSACSAPSSRSTWCSSSSPSRSCWPRCTS